MSITLEAIKFLKDKIQSWPEEMCLTSTDVADLLAVLNDYARFQPLIEAAGGWDASKLAHLTTARRKDKCETCDEATKMVLELADILTDIEFPANTTPSPGPTEADERAMGDEIALKQLAEAVEYLSPKVVLPVTGGGYETLVSLCKSALAHLRSRLGERTTEK